MVRAGSVELRVCIIRIDNGRELSLWADLASVSLGWQGCFGSQKQF